MVELPSPLHPSGVLGRLVSFLLGLLYKAGSLLYLTATAILCLDVLILSWYTCILPHSVFFVTHTVHVHACTCTRVVHVV